MTDNLIPIPGAYAAWFTGPDDYDVFALPVIGLLPRQAFYTDVPGEDPTNEYDPVAIDRPWPTPFSPEGIAQ